MKRGKKLLILLGVLVVLAAGALAATLLNGENQGTAEEPKESVLNLTAEAITSIAWSDGGETLSFSRTNEGWAYDDDAAFPLTQSYLDTMAEALAGLTTAKTLDWPDDPDDYGLEEPLYTVTITTEEGMTLQVLLGLETAMGGERYLSKGDGKVYLVDADILQNFAYGLYDLVQMESIPSMTNVQQMTVTTSGRSLELCYLEDSGLSYSDSYVWFLREGETWRTLDTALTESFLETVMGLSWKTCVNYSAGSAELADYGLDSPAATVQIDYVRSVSVDTGETDENGSPVYEQQQEPAVFTLELGKRDGSVCYARLGGSRMVYQVDSTLLDTLSYTTYEELQPDEVLAMDFDTVTAVEVTMDGQTVRMEKTTEEQTDDEGTVTQSIVWKANGKTVTDDSFLEDLNSMRSAGYSSGMTPAGEAQIVFRFERNAETFSQVELAFYAYDSSSCMVTLDGKATVFADREKVADLQQTLTSLFS